MSKYYSHRRLLSLALAFTLSLSLMGTLFVGVALSAEPVPTPNQPGGLVPCGKGDAGPMDCDLLKLIKLVNNVLKFLLYAGTVVASILVLYAGIMMVYYGSTNPGKVSSARGTIWNVVVGYSIMLAAWLVVKQLVEFFAREGGVLRQAIDIVFN